MLLARRTLSLLDFTYKLIAGRNKRDVVRLPSGVTEELLLCCLLAPLMYVNLRQRYDDKSLLPMPLHGARPECLLKLLPTLLERLPGTPVQKGLGPDSSAPVKPG